MHEGELPRVIELEARDALSRRGDRWFRELSQLPAIDKEPFASSLSDWGLISVCQQFCCGMSG
jgi:hypothetical protein